jgi:hypothetical protein
MDAGFEMFPKIRCLKDIRKEEGLDLNETRQFIHYADNVYFVGKNIDTIEENKDGSLRR